MDLLENKVNIHPLLFLPVLYFVLTRGSQASDIVFSGSYTLKENTSK
jgi:hypothetical protein